MHIYSISFLALLTANRLHRSPLNTPTPSPYSTLDTNTLMAKSPGGMTYDGCVAQYGMIVVGICVGVGIFVIVSWCLILRFVTKRMIRRMDEVRVHVKSPPLSPLVSPLTPPLPTPTAPPPLSSWTSKRT